MSHHLTEQQLIELRQAFAWFDKKNEGVITADNLKQCLNGLGFFPRQSQLTQMIESVVSAPEIQNQAIDFQDFLVMMANVLEKSDASKELKHVFNLLDVDGNGEITVEEMYLMFKALGEEYSMEDVEEMLRISDYNSDGVIQFEEFVKMLMH